MSRPRDATTFRELCRMEPRLRALYDEARAVRDDGDPRGFCANAVWYGFGRYHDRGLKPRLVRLVGSCAGTIETPNVLGIPDERRVGIISLNDFLAKGREEVRDPNTDPRLRTSEAYDVAYKTIYAALPDCRNCLCGP